MRKFRLLFQKGVTLPHQLTWEHLKIIKRNNLSYRKLADRIKSDEYDRLVLEIKIK